MILLQATKRSRHTFKSQYNTISRMKNIVIVVVLVCSGCCQCVTISEIFSLVQKREPPSTVLEAYLCGLLNAYCRNSKTSTEEHENHHVGEYQSLATVESDVVVTQDRWRSLQEEETTTETSTVRRRQKRRAIRQLTARWPNAEIPYEFDSSFSDLEQEEVMAAMTEWQESTCLIFRPKTSEDNNSVLFEDGSGCYSYTGMMSIQPQPITLHPVCRIKMVALHYIGHALGMWHPHNRPDRDDYVSIIRENLISGLVSYFVKYSEEDINTYNIPYDYFSIMHADPHVYSKNGEATIVTKDPTYQDIVGKATSLSEKDIAMANAMYGCNRTNMWEPETFLENRNLEEPTLNTSFDLYLGLGVATGTLMVVGFILVTLCFCAGYRCGKQEVTFTVSPIYNGTAVEKRGMNSCISALHCFGYSLQKETIEMELNEAYDRKEPIYEDIDDIKSIRLVNSVMNPETGVHKIQKS